MSCQKKHENAAMICHVCFMELEAENAKLRTELGRIGRAKEEYAMRARAQEDKVKALELQNGEMKRLCVQAVARKLHHICGNLEQAMPGIDGPSILSQLTDAIMSIEFIEKRNEEVPICDCGHRPDFHRPDGRCGVSSCPCMVFRDTR